MADIPDEFFEWQLANRRKNIEHMLRSKEPSLREKLGLSLVGKVYRFFGLERPKGSGMSAEMLDLHDPVMATQSPRDQRMNLASKGVGLVLAAEEAMREFTEKADGLIERTYETSGRETLDERLQLLLEYIYPELDAGGRWKENYNLSSLGTLEMFGGRTYMNIISCIGTAHASLMYNALKPRGGYFSQQFNADVTVHPKGSAFYEYFVALHDLFHVPPKEMREKRKERFFCAYEFTVTEVYDKAPGPNAGKRIR